MEARIYLSVDSKAPKESEKKFAYVLEYTGKAGIRTSEGFGILTGTYNAAVLTALIGALERFTKPCELTIHSENQFINNMIVNCLDKWKEDEFKNSKGEPIKNSEQWEKVAELTEKHSLLIVTGKHEYTDWMSREMEKKCLKDSEK